MNTETETKPEAERPTGSVTGSEPGSVFVVVVACLLLFLLLLFFFCLLCVASFLQVICSCLRMCCEMVKKKQQLEIILRHDSKTSYYRGLPI